MNDFSMQQQLYFTLTRVATCETSTSLHLTQWHQKCGRLLEINCMRSYDTVAVQLKAVQDNHTASGKRSQVKPT